jgi:hypothetical protein
VRPQEIRSSNPALLTASINSSTSIWCTWALEPSESIWIEVTGAVPSETDPVGPDAVDAAVLAADGAPEGRVLARGADELAGWLWRKSNLRYQAAAKASAVTPAAPRTSTPPR